MEWAVRPAEPADVEAIAELRAMVMRPDLERLGRFDEYRVRQRLRDAFSRSTHRSSRPTAPSRAASHCGRPGTGGGWSTSISRHAPRAGGSVRLCCEHCWTGPMPTTYPSACTSCRAAPPGGCTSATDSLWRVRTRSTSTWCDHRVPAPTERSAARDLPGRPTRKAATHWTRCHLTGRSRHFEFRQSEEVCDHLHDPHHVVAFVQLRELPVGASAATVAVRTAATAPWAGVRWPEWLFYQATGSS